MGEPVLRQGQWWQQRADDVWLRWNSWSQKWEEQDRSPPPATPTDAQATATQQAYEIEPYRSPVPLSRTLLLLLSIAFVVDVIAVAAGVSERSLLGRAQRGGIVTPAQAEANDTRVMVIGFTQAALFLVTMPIWLLWFRRTYRNLPALGARNLRFKPGWAVGAWFVPFLNLVRPVRMTTDIWQASTPAMDVAPGTPWGSQSSSPLIGFWWAAWLIANYASNIAIRLSFGGDDLDSLAASSLAWIVADSVSATLDVLAIVLVCRITSRQEQRARKLATAGTLVGSP